MAYVMMSPTEIKYAISDLRAVFYDWVNNYLTVEKMAEDYKVPVTTMHALIAAGRVFHDMEAE